MAMVHLVSLTMHPNVLTMMAELVMGMPAVDKFSVMCDTHLYLLLLLERSSKGRRLCEQVL